MKVFLKTVDNLSKWSGTLTLYMLLTLVAILFVGVIARYVFNAPLKWSYEFSVFVFGASFMLAGSYCLLSESHVSVDAVTERFSLRNKAIFKIIGLIVIIFFSGMLLYEGGSMAWDSVARHETTGTFWNPVIWPVKLMIPIAAVLMILQAVANLIRNIRVVTASEDNRLEEKSE